MGNSILPHVAVLAVGVHRGGIGKRVGLPSRHFALSLRGQLDDASGRGLRPPRARRMPMPPSSDRRGHQSRSAVRGPSSQPRPGGGGSDGPQAVGNQSDGDEHAAEQQGRCARASRGAREAVRRHDYAVEMAANNGDVVIANWSGRAAAHAREGACLPLIAVTPEKTAETYGWILFPWC